MDLNVSHIPEDRHKFGMAGAMSVEENLILISYKYDRYSKSGLLNWKWIADHCKNIVRDFSVKTPSF